jgi:SAM-dependent methyltransferase
MAAPATSSPRRPLPDVVGPEPYPRAVGTRTDPDCCTQPPDPRIARQFDARYEGWTPEEGFPELVDVSGAILDLCRDTALRRPSVLDLGCGTGALGVALLAMGASRLTGVDLSPASIDLARQRAEDAGFSEVSAFEVGNAAETSVPHDWVVLDRVICCYGDADGLVERAIDLATERIAIAVPESRGWRGLVNRALWFAEFAWDRLQGGCRGYVHDLGRIERRLADAGFRRVDTDRVGLWFIGLYDRPKTSDSPCSRSRGA